MPYLHIGEALQKNQKKKIDWVNWLSENSKKNVNDLNEIIGKKKKAL